MSGADRALPLYCIAVCREITKAHEEVTRGTASELAERFAEGARGEITLVIEGSDEAEVPDDAEELDALIRRRLEAGDSASHSLAAGRRIYVHLVGGRIEVDGELLGEGDGATLSATDRVVFHGETRAEALVFDLP